VSILDGGMESGGAVALLKPGLAGVLFFDRERGRVLRVRCRFHSGCSLSCTPRRKDAGPRTSGGLIELAGPLGQLLLVVHGSHGCVSTLLGLSDIFQLKR
jgi:hypothetical protein